MTHHPLDDAVEVVVAFVVVLLLEVDVVVPPTLTGVLPEPRSS